MIENGTYHNDLIIKRVCEHFILQKCSGKSIPFSKKCYYRGLKKCSERTIASLFFQESFGRVSQQKYLPNH